jgi:hypothetical protein
MCSRYAHVCRTNNGQDLLITVSTSAPSVVALSFLPSKPCSISSASRVPTRPTQDRTPSARHSWLLHPSWWASCPSSARSLLAASSIPFWHTTARRRRTLLYQDRVCRNLHPRLSCLLRRSRPVNVGLINMISIFFFDLAHYRLPPVTHLPCNVIIIFNLQCHEMGVLIYLCLNKNSDQIFRHSPSLTMRHLLLPEAKSTLLVSYPSPIWCILPSSCALS